MLQCCMTVTLHVPSVLSLLLAAASCHLTPCTNLHHLADSIWCCLVARQAVRIPMHFAWVVLYLLYLLFQQTRECYLHENLNQALWTARNTTISSVQHFVRLAHAFKPDECFMINAHYHFAAPDHVAIVSLGASLGGLYTPRRGKCNESCRGLVVMSCDSHSRGCGF